MHLAGFRVLCLRVCFAVLETAVIGMGVVWVLGGEWRVEAVYGHRFTVVHVACHLALFGLVVVCWVAALKAEGCHVLDKIDDSGYGKFAWVIDPEGNKVEKIWKRPRQWGLGVGIFLFLVIVFQCYLWGRSLNDSRFATLHANQSTLHFVLFSELPIFVAGVSCALLRFYNPNPSTNPAA